ncbi:hypothetical protein VIGAN_04246000, partial [Vigna angularis var. angularis]
MASSPVIMVFMFPSLWPSFPRAPMFVRCSNSSCTTKAAKGIIWFIATSVGASRMALTLSKAVAAFGDISGF